MTRRAAVLDAAQTSLFDRLEPVPLADFGQQVRIVFGETLATARQRGMDRAALADAMNRAMGAGTGECREVTKRQLDNWAAPSATDWRMPLEALPALTRATGDARLLTLLATACDQRVVPAEASEFADLLVIKLQQQKLARAERAIARRLPRGAVDWAAQQAARRGGL